MFKSIKNAFSELEHVVWPTEAESKKYMVYTVGAIIFMGAFLALIGYMLSGSLSGVRGQFSQYHAQTPVVSGSGEDLVTEADLENLQKAAAVKQAADNASGITIEPLTLSGAQ